MKIIVDINVVLDVLLKRPSFYQDSFAVFRLIDQERLIGCISASVITDIFYIANKEIKDVETVYQAIENLAGIFSVVPVCESTIASALALRWKDFEDAVQFITAKESNVEYIITRNKADYVTSDIPCISPTEFIAYFKEKEEKNE